VGVAGTAGYGSFFSNSFSDPQKKVLADITVSGLVSIVFGLVIIWVASALWKLENWAWYLAFLFALLFCAGAVFSGMKGGWTQAVIIPTVIYGLLCLYLLAVKNHFGKS
jgi:hypothetical protein